MMITLKIDNREIVAEAGTKLIEVARKNGIDIPSLCYAGHLPHYTSCLVCLVRDIKTGKFIPSCSLNAEDGMEIDSTGDEVIKLRRESLSMLLSEHRAECEAPCKLVCPVGLDIPKLNRLIAKGEIAEGGELAFSEMGLPSTICKLCPAYCENACRRKMVDHKIAISALVSNSSQAFNTNNGKRKSAGKRIAIIGGGASGIITAHFLSQEGHSCEIFEKEKYPGGSIVSGFNDSGLPLKSATDEINRVLAGGTKMNCNVTVDSKYIEGKLVQNFDSIIVTTGEKHELKGAEISTLFLQEEGDIVILSKRYIFMPGPGKENQLFVRKIGSAKKLAEKISRFLLSGEIEISPKRFNSVIGKIEEGEKREWLKESAADSIRFSLPDGIEESKSEASNCLHCDCRAAGACGLRDLCNQMNIKNPNSKFTAYPIEKKMDNSHGIIFEHAKCIKCGLCVRIMENRTNDPSLCFTGRGFMTIIAEPLTYGFDDFNREKIDMAIDICPTGALTKREI